MRGYTIALYLLNLVLMPLICGFVEASNILGPSVHSLMYLECVEQPWRP